MRQTVTVPMLPANLVEFTVVLGIGLLIGVERERNKGSGPDRAAAGVRTFVLCALAGGVAGLLGTAALVVAGLVIGWLAASSYRRSRDADPGLTTEVAMLVTFLLGCLALRAPALAGALGVVVALVLASKSRLHRFVREALTETEMQDLLILMAAAFVVLPLLPADPVDPWGVIDLRRLWALVVAVMAVSSAGYVALRAFGSRLGLTLAGFAGGFVSSTATIASMGERARELPAHRAAFAGAALASNVGTVVQLAVVLAALAPSLLRPAGVPLLAAGLVALAAALVAGVRSGNGGDGRHPPPPRRPFELRQVLAFVALLAAIILVAGIARHWLGEQSLPWVLAATGMADVHAAAASAAQLTAAGQISEELAMQCILAALATNSLSKCIVAYARGGGAFVAQVAPGIVLMVSAFAVALLLQA